ncbi:MAG: 30S ribosomal protein S17 [Chloroflexota bacterium]
MTDERTIKRTKQGVVVSDKMDKTVVVAVEHLRRHRLYGRHVRRTRRFKAHDESNQCRLGDSVIIEESRPMSRDKRWLVQKVLRSSFVADLDSLAGVPETAPDETPAAEASA